jgi:3-oxoacyl-[acyl-carrier protein] reductase
MDLKLRDKIALVTGASSGIGAATAQLLAEEGADVVVCYGQDAAGAALTAHAVQAAGRRAWLCQMDVSNAETVSSVMAQLGPEVGALDILILCAGQNIITLFEELTPEEWGKIVNVNLNGPFYVLRAALPYLRDGASVVTVASVAAQTGAPRQLCCRQSRAGQSD